jgi:hypothetical protein
MTLLIISIALEVAVAVVAALGALKGRPYLYGLALPFTVYVLYDLGRLLSIGQRQRSIRGLEPLPRQGIIAPSPVAVT